MIRAAVSKNSVGTSVELTIDGGEGDTINMLVDVALETLKKLKSGEY